MRKHSFAFLIAALLSSFFLAAPLRAQTKTLAERLGYPADAKLLVIHADDVGVAHSVNTATFEALEKHWVTSASIMVPCSWFPEVAAWAKAHPDADLGIHLTLNAEWTPYRWGPVSGLPLDSTLRDPDGYLPLTTKYVVEHAKPADVAKETHAQVDKAKAAGIRLSHLDTHMGTIVSSPEFLPIYFELAKDYQLPQLLLRQLAPPGQSFPPDAVVLDQLFMLNSSVPKSDWQAPYRKMLTGLPPGVYELIVHLGHDDEELRAVTSGHPDFGAAWRQNDLNLVGDPAFQQFLKDQHFVLVSWKDLDKAAHTK